MPQTLTVRLGDPTALLRKLEREAYRAYHAANAIAMADHLCNFCITAESMKDYCLEHEGIVDSDSKRPFQACWKRNDALLAAHEIANTAKHFTLRDTRNGKPKRVATRVAHGQAAGYFDVYESERGDIQIVARRRREICVILEGGKRLQLHEFCAAIVNYWRKYLAEELGLKIRRQSFRQLSSQG